MLQLCSYIYSSTLRSINQLNLFNTQYRGRGREPGYVSQKQKNVPPKEHCFPPKNVIHVSAEAIRLANVCDNNSANAMLCVQFTPITR